MTFKKLKNKREIEEKKNEHRDESAKGNGTGNEYK